MFLSVVILFPMCLPVFSQGRKIPQFHTTRRDAPLSGGKQEFAFYSSVDPNSLRISSYGWRHILRMFPASLEEHQELEQEANCHHCNHIFRDSHCLPSNLIFAVPEAETDLSSNSNKKWHSRPFLVYIRW